MSEEFKVGDKIIYAVTNHPAKARDSKTIAHEYTFKGEIVEVHTAKKRFKVRLVSPSGRVKTIWSPLKRLRK